MRTRLTPEKLRKIRSMLAYGAHYRAIARVVGLSPATIGNVARGSAGRRKRPTPSIADVLGPVKTTPGDPSEDEIAEACAKLRKHRPRPSVRQSRWTAPEIGLVLTKGGA